MKPKKKLLKKSRLYLILDKKTCANKPLNLIAGKIKDSKIDIIQLRAKDENKNNLLKEAIRLNRIFKSSGKIFIINDYPEIAKIADCDGVHLGQNDSSVKKTRKLLGKNKIIGVSCHSLKQARIAQRQGADYIGIGPLFATKTKPDYPPIGLRGLKELEGKIKIPYFAIGDIKQDNIESVVAQGAKRAAICRAILEKDNFKEIADRIYKVLN
ncbi:MAG: thiamine phosphate synthase [Candidatus Omnitrophota bacterium]|jgi:thiamine-phosphate pyrophosphorylase